MNQVNEDALFNFKILFSVICFSEFNSHPSHSMLNLLVCGFQNCSDIIIIIISSGDTKE